jgi:hypothetical protein
MTTACNGIYFFDHSLISTLQFVAKNPTFLPKSECYKGLGVDENEWGALNWWDIIDNRFVQFHLQSEPQIKRVGNVITEITYTHDGKTASLVRITKDVFERSVKELLKNPQEDLDDDEAVQDFLVNYNVYF